MSTCPTCGSVSKNTNINRDNSMINTREYGRTLRRFQMNIQDYMRSTKSVKLDSCILCVQKHVSRAMIYHEQLLMSKGSGKEDGTAKINEVKNHLKIIGHLGCAIQQSEQFIQLNEFLISTERNYRYNYIAPDWTKIIQLISKVLEEQEK